MTLVRRVILVVAVAALVPVTAGAAAAQAPKPEATATQAYEAYRKALATANAIEDILPMMSASRRAQVEKTPADERTMMFGMVKSMAAAQGDVKVRKETPAAAGAELAVDAKDGAGVVRMVKEGGAWKVDQESWKSKM